MPLIKCPATTCIHYSSGMCIAKAIEMTDFEYYEDSEGKRRDIFEDDMKCNSYESQNRKGKENE